MNRRGNLKKRYSNNRAQSLTELATFGSVLLLVLSFFISYGMRYIYQQDVGMRAYRMALADAYSKNTPDASSAVTLVEDKHIPNPRDTFGVGDVETMEGEGGVTWGNSLQNRYLTQADLPRNRYVIDGRVHEYTTSGYNTISRNNSPGGFYIQIYGQDKRTFIDWNSVSAVFTPDSSQTRILLPDNQTDLIGEIATSESETATMKQIVSPLPVPIFTEDQVANKEQIIVYPVNGFLVLDGANGQINQDYLSLGTDFNNDNIPDVTPSNLQGLLLPDVRTSRSDKLNLEEKSGTGYYKSKNDIGTSVTVTHKIKGNAATPETFPETYTITGASKTWQTPK